MKSKFNQTSLVLIAIFGIIISALAQGQSHLTIGIYMKPGGYNEIEPDQTTKLETRIINVISMSGSTFNISASRVEPDTTSADNTPNMMETMARGVVCYPKFEIYSERKADTGLEKITVVEASLTLAVQYIHEDIIFSSLSMTLQGSGNNKRQAINSIIRNIRPQDPKWQSFVQETRRKIVNYYDNQCDAIIAKAKQLDRLDSPWNAVQILWPIPQDVDCYSRVKDLTVEIYLRAINQVCRQELLRAKTELAADQYERSLYHLRRIDPKSNCYEEVLKMIDTIAAEVDRVSTQERANNLALEKLRLQVEKERNESNYMETSIAKRNSKIIRESIIEQYD